MSKKIDQPYKQTLNVGILFGETGPVESSHSIALSEIIINPDQPRRYFDTEAMDSLIASIQQHGILQPLLVQPKNEMGYPLIAGERRYRAAEALGLEFVPIVVCGLDDQEAWIIALTENLQREDLNPVEETKGILKLLSWKLQIEDDAVKSLLYRLRDEHKGKVPHNVMGGNSFEIINQVFDELGTQTWESFTTNRLPILNLPSDILRVLETGLIAYTKAIAIAKVKDETKRAELLEESIQNSLSLIQIKEKIATLKSSPDLVSPQNQLQSLTRRLNQLKLWEKDKKTWKKVEGLLGKIEMMIAGMETEV
jgi:ParB family chromosome partitioning protein